MTQPEIPPTDDKIPTNSFDDFLRPKETVEETLSSKAEQDTRPVVMTDELHQAVTDSMGPLAGSGLVYQRNNRLVQLIKTKKPPEGSEVIREEDQPVIAQIESTYLLEVLDRAISWQKYDKRSKKHVRCKPPRDVCASLHDRGHWDHIPSLRGISTIPIMRKDGTLAFKPGYDAESGLFYCPNCPKPVIPGCTNQQEAHLFANDLLDIVQDFPFSTPEQKSAWLAMALSVIAKPSFDGEGGIPLLLIDSSTPGTGKSLLADVMSVLATGFKATRSPYVAEDDEMRKSITSRLMAGDQIVLIDNCKSGTTVGWPSLDNAITAEVWSDRELGRSQIARVPMKTVFVITGNNLRVKADAARRTLRIRLDAKEVRPEQRTGFKWNPIIDRLRQERPFLLGKALSIVSQYLWEGAPSQGLTAVGSFEGWNRVIRNCLVWAGLPDPAKAFVSENLDVDEEAEAHTQILSLWHLFDSASKGITSAEILHQLQHREDMGPFRDAMETFIPTRDGSLPTSHRLGNMLRSLLGRMRIVDDKLLRIEYGDRDGKNKVVRWVVAEEQKQVLISMQEPIPACTRIPAEDDDKKAGTRVYAGTSSPKREKVAGATFSLGAGTVPPYTRVPAYIEHPEIIENQVVECAELEDSKSQDSQEVEGLSNTEREPGCDDDLGDPKSQEGGSLEDNQEGGLEEPDNQDTGVSEDNQDTGVSETPWWNDEDEKF